jgi:hypothetical protein
VTAAARDQGRWDSATTASTECYEGIVVGSAAKLNNRCFHKEGEAILPTIYSLTRPHVTIRFFSAAKAETDASRPGSAEQATSQTRNPFRFDRIIATHIDQGLDWMPGDRLMWARIAVEPINFRFVADRFIPPEYETLETQLEATVSSKHSTDVGVAIPGIEGPKADIGASGENSVRSTTITSARYENSAPVWTRIS